MKKKWILGVGLILFTSLFCVPQVYASTQDINGKVTVEDPGTSNLVDPEAPSTVVNPGEGPSTTGALRIDYISSLNFGSQKINDTNRTYLSLAQQFHNETTARGFYIQISDYSSESSGWNLTVTQNQQFHSDIIQDLENQELTGAVLSFDKGWANTSGASGAPTVTRDTLALNEMGIAYTVASSKAGQGKGVWLIEFGASETNTSNQVPTLSPLEDASGKAVLDNVTNKQAYSNSAVTLTVPKEAKIYPVQYTTTLTWTLEAAPTR
ncbi:WxL domain-containing protein [Enterococcus sp. LJL90]